MENVKNLVMLMAAGLMLLPVPLLAQTDKPLPDIPELIRAERKKADAESAIWKAANRILADKSAAKSGDLNLAAAAIHADIHRCLVLGDFRRTEAALYEKAEKAAGEVAEAWEMKGQQTGPEAQPSPAEDGFRGQYESAGSAIAELEQKATLTAQEEEKLRELRDAKQRLGDALALLKRVREKVSDPQKYLNGAREMRLRERFFHMSAEAARTAAGAHDGECEAGLLMLRALEEEEQIQNEIRRWTEGWPSEDDKKGRRQ